MTTPLYDPLSLYPWSSTAAHCQLQADPVLTTKARWWSPFDAVGDWSAWLAEGDEPEHLAVIDAISKKACHVAMSVFGRN